MSDQLRRCGLAIEGTWDERSNTWIYCSKAVGHDGPCRGAVAYPNVEKTPRNKAPDNLRVLAENENKLNARALREMADRVESERHPVRGFAYVIIYSNGAVGCDYGTSNRAALVGAVETVKHRILQEWEDEFEEA